LKKLVQCLATTATMTSTILILLAGTNVFVSFITMSRLPQYLVGLVSRLNAPYLVLVLAVIAIYLVLGMFLPDTPLIVLTVPIMYPIITALGWDPIWFGCLVVFMQALGSVTPPVGMAVYLLSGLANVPVTKIFKGVTPFIVGMVLVIILIVAFPSLTTFLPAMMS
jgi:TRAP-type C4-dicarboxylate transport system permease large subunit